MKAKTYIVDGNRRFVARNLPALAAQLGWQLGPEKRFWAVLIQHVNGREVDHYVRKPGK